MNKNRFFSLALRKAALLAGKKGRIMLLLVQLGNKMKSVDWKNIKLADAKDKFLILGRLAKAYAQGDYRDIELKNALLILAAVIYFVSPIDLLPDFLPFTGLTDDLGVLLWVYNTVNTEIDKFLTWEKTRLT